MKPGFQYRALFGWGIAIYASMFLLWSFFIKYGFVSGFLPSMISIVILIVVTSLAGRSLHFSSWRDILPYSVGWAIVVVILDVLLTVPFTGWGIFTHPRVIVGYLLIITVPLLFYERLRLAGTENMHT